MAASAPARLVIHAEALAWLNDNGAQPLDAVVTSLPDVSELPLLGGLDGWKRWFIDAAGRVMTWTAPGMPSVFFQSDIRYQGAWLDKAYLVQKAAEVVGAELVFHKIVCRRPAGTLSQGRASYSHLLAFTRGGTPLIPRKPSADVLPDAGDMPWSRAMGTRACAAACRFLLDETGARRVVDPFCGKGTVLAVANALGLDALGVELSAKRCRAARNLTVELA